MLMFFKRLLAKWVREGRSRPVLSDNVLESLGMGREGNVNTTPKFRISFIPAINGHVLEISTEVTDSRGNSEYKFELYLVRENQKLSEAIANLVAMKDLES